MEQMEVLDVIRELLETKQYTRLRQKISDMNIADIAALMEELEEEELLKVFRILPKSMAADVFSYLEVDNQQFIITSLSEKDAARGMVPYIHSGEAIPSALAAAIPNTPSRFPCIERNRS